MKRTLTLSFMVMVVGLLISTTSGWTQELNQQLETLDRQAAKTYHPIRFKIDQIKHEMAQKLAKLESELIAVKKEDEESLKQDWTEFADTIQEQFQALNAEVKDTELSFIKSWSEEAKSFESHLFSMRKQLEMGGLKAEEAEKEVYQKARYLHSKLDYLWNSAAAESSELAEALDTELKDARRQVIAYYDQMCSKMQKSIDAEKATAAKQPAVKKTKTTKKEESKLSKLQSEYAALKVKVEELKKASDDSWQKIRKEIKELVE